MKLNTLNLSDLKPLVAILRGVKPSEVLGVAAVIVEAGIEIIEVPLNSPDPFSSIELLAQHFGDSCLIGAGTVLSVDQVNKVHAAGGQLVVSPNTVTAVIEASKSLDMISFPGCLTPTEAFAALDAGADALKIFPSNTVAPGFFKAIKSVLPAGTTLYAVGGIDELNLIDFYEQGATGFGFGSSLYKPGKSLEAIADSANACVGAYKKAIDK